MRILKIPGNILTPLFAQRNPMKFSTFSPEKPKIVWGFFPKEGIKHFEAFVILRPDLKVHKRRLINRIRQ
jgi:hypothetical protein